MNHKSQEWLTLSQWLRQREQQLRRAGQMGASTPSAKLPHLEDVELQAFVRENNLTEANSQRCRQLEVEAAYQAILAAPGSEQSILEQLGYTQDKSRLDSIYAHASTYTRWLEDEAMRESSLIQRTGRRGRWLQVALLVAIVLCLTVGGWGYFTFQSWKRYLENPAGTQKGNTKLVIPRGSDTETVARLLKESGVIQQQEQFFLLVRYHHYLKNIFPELQRVGRVRLRAGTYEISTNLTPQQILSVLRKGPKRKSIRVTIPEGFNLWKIAARLEKKGVCRSADFIRYAKDPNHARKVLGWEAPRLEGYLYPDTYRFFKNTSPTLVIERMVGRFKKVFNPTFRKRAQELGCGEAGRHEYEIPRASFIGLHSRRGVGLEPLQPQSCLDASRDLAERLVWLLGVELLARSHGEARQALQGRDR